MNLPFNLIKEIKELIKMKYQYFLTFSEIAALKEKYGQANQYKTEKWFQAEILYNLCSKGVKCIPEYGKDRWDIFIPKNKIISKPIFVALKCFIDSAQNANKDFKGILDDLSKIKKIEPSNGDSFFILLLPLNKRKDYTIEILKLLENAINSKIHATNYKINPEKKISRGILLVICKLIKK